MLYFRIPVGLRSFVIPHLPLTVSHEFRRVLLLYILYPDLPHPDTGEFGSLEALLRSTVNGFPIPQGLCLSQPQVEVPLLRGLHGIG